MDVWVISATEYRIVPLPGTGVECRFAYRSPISGVTSQGISLVAIPAGALATVLADDSLGSPGGV